MTNIAPIIQALPILSRVARSVLDWNQVEAGVRTGIPKISLGRFEILTGNLNAVQCGLLLDAFSANGVNFSVEGKTVHVMIDAETIVSSMKKLKGPERKRADYKGIRPINAPFSEEEMACADEIQRKLKEAYSK